MSSVLIENLTEIKRQKDEYIKPENLKRGIEVYGITGTLDVETIPPDVKVFETQEQMQNDIEAKEDDLAVVYHSEIKNAQADSIFSKAMFPKTVTLDTAITNYVNIGYEAIDTSQRFNCMGDLSNNNFRMDCYGDNKNIRIEYISSDGITYTRQRLEGDGVNGDNVDFGVDIQYSNPEYWNDAIGKFIQIGDSYFDGLYKYGNSDEVLEYSLCGIGDIVPQDKSMSYSTNIINNISPILANRLMEIYGAFCSEFGITGDPDTFNVSICYINDDLSHFAILFQGDKCILCNTDNTGIRIVDAYLTGYGSDDIGAKYVWYDIENDTYTFVVVPGRTVYKEAYSNWYYTDVFASKVNFISHNIFRGESITFGKNYPVELKYINGSTETTILSSTDMGGEAIYRKKYNIAPTQLTIKNSNELIQDKISYGKDGIVTGDGSITQPNSVFSDIPAQLYVQIQQNYENMEPRVLTDTDNLVDIHMYLIPTKSDGTPLLDTSRVTDMTNIFGDCTRLTSIPVLNTSKATNMSSMFNNCNHLVTISLLDTSKATNMSDMFNACSRLTTIPLLDTSNVTDMGRMFNMCRSLTTIPLLDTSNVKRMSSMFNECISLTTIPLLDTSNVTEIGSFFYDCSSLTSVPQLNTSSATDMFGMFNKCSSLTSIPELNTSNVKYMGYMFSGCSSLVSVPQLNTSNVTKMDKMFNNCPNLSDSSLGNILAMCINSAVSTKTLKYIGLTQEQTERCKTLSNYEMFTSAGWTTGY